MNKEFEKMDPYDSYIEEICRKLRLTVSEFGQESLNNAVILHSYRDIDHISDIKCIYVPTISKTTLGGVEFQVARFFEDF